jgi:DNA polymerase
VLGGAHASQDEIDLLLRATLFAKPGHVLAVCDFSGVEGRGNAWCAGDEYALEVIAKSDPYMVAAAEVYGIDISGLTPDGGIPSKKQLATIITKEQRQIGKVADLACGYGGGEGAIARFAAAMGIDLEANGVDAAEVVAAWRELHAPIVRFWHATERAFTSAVRGKEADVACFRFVPSDNGEDVAIFMPSGRPIVYPKVAVRADYKDRPQISYEGSHDARPFGPSGKREGDPVPMREKLYGGLLVENCIQALCRDLMADALVRCEDAGLSPVLHVHDEIVCEVPREAAREGFELLKAIMTDVPAWAEGFPLGAAGHTGSRYRK